MLKILMMAALPNEYAPLRKITPPWRSVSGSSFKTFSFALPGKQITLIETGMGGMLAREALQNHLRTSRPDLLLFAGFGGGLHEGLAVGDVCAITQAMEYPARQEPNRGVYKFIFSKELVSLLATEGIVTVTAVTVSALTEKLKLAGLLAGSVGTVDMETAGIAAISEQEGIPFICLRAISDALHDELGFDLKDITGKTGKVEIWRVLKTVLSKPRIIAAFYRSWTRSSLAARNLARAVAALLNLRSDSLRGIAATIRLDVL